MTTHFITRTSTGHNPKVYLRKNEIRSIFDMYIASSRPQCLIINGNAKSGKTSIVELMSSPDIQPDYIDKVEEYEFILMKCQPGYGSIDDFFRELFSKIGLTIEQDNYKVFNEWIKQKVKQEKKIVLFMDDFQNLTENEVIPLDFYSYFRAMANENPLGLILTGPKNLHNTVANKGLMESPFFNIFNSLTLDKVKEKEALKYIKETASISGADFSDEMAGWIVEMAGLFPYTINQLGDLLLSQSISRIPEKKELKKIEEEHLARIKEFVLKIYSGLDSNGQEIIKSFAVSKKTDGAGKIALKKLERSGLLKKDGNEYKLASPVFGDIIKGKSGKSGSKIKFWK